jgi:hypothetical protein
LNFCPKPEDKKWSLNQESNPRKMTSIAAKEIYSKFLDPM